MVRCCKRKRRFDQMDGSSRNTQGSLKAAAEPLLRQESSQKRERERLENQHSDASLRVLAAQTLKIASINGLGDAEKLETELEDEIRWEENRHPPSEVIGRLRRRCEDVLHAKPMLLFIVVLNIIDCLLVIGELTLDFHHISNRYLARTEHSEEFLERIQDLYSPRLQHLNGVEEEDLTAFMDHFLRAFIFWDAANYTQASLAADCQSLMWNYSFPSASSNATTSNATSNNNISNSSNSSSSNSSSNVLSRLLAYGAGPLQKMNPMDREHYDVVGTAHALHYASLSILTFLLVECLLKIACVGPRFLKKRMEVFDAVIIAISFTLDIIFVEGLTNLHIQHYVIVLSFLLPWRVLRVLNSLIVAVMVQHRFHLKLLYKQKRKINKQLQESTDNAKTLEKQVQLLKGLCTSNGVPDWQVNKVIGQTLSSSSQGGLKALSKLVFHAAESFAPFSSASQGRLNLNLNHNHSNNSGGGGGLSSTDVVDHSSSAPAITIQCNGDVEQPPSNGHVHILQEESHVESGTSAASSRKNSGSPGSSISGSPDQQPPVFTIQVEDECSPQTSRKSEEDDEDEEGEEGGKVPSDEVDSGNLTFDLAEDSAEAAEEAGVVEMEDSTAATTRL